MPRSMWTGSISFGLVNVPVKLYPAVRSKSLSFVQLHAPDGGRIRYRKVCELDEEEVPNEEIAKAHEVAPGQYVVVTPEELEAADPDASKTISLEDFVDLTEIDPVYYDKPYYLGPYNQAAERPYQLLVQAMAESGKVAIGRMVMRNKEYLAALRPVEGVLVLCTMNWADEVLSPGEVAPTTEVNATEKEVTMARQLIESLTTDFVPDRYADTYRERLVALIEKKAEGEEVVAPAQPSEPKGTVVDLMSALEQSLADARQRRQAQRSQTRTSETGKAGGSGKGSGKGKAGGAKGAGKTASRKKKASG